MIAHLFTKFGEFGPLVFELCVSVFGTTKTSEKRIDYQQLAAAGAFVL